jgi:hypothetical protein
MRNRSLLAVVVMLLAGMAFTAGIGTGRVNAQDDAELTASVVEGSCDSPGDTAGELRDLSATEGGVLTSFSRVDVAIDDLTGDDYAIVVASDGDVAACGDIAGEGDDVYVPVTSRSDDGYGGIAWLHARDEQTQVSLFISQGLGGSGDNNNTSPDPPEPPVDDTPEPRATRTPRAEPTEQTNQPTGENVYESPTFGYSLTYDDTWEIVEEATTPTDNGPQDFLHMFNRTSHAYLFTNAAPETFPIEQFPNVMLGRAENNPAYSNVQVMKDADGNDLIGNDGTSAWIVYTFTLTTQDGQTFELFDYVRGYKLPGQPAVLLFINEGLEIAYDIEAPAREALMNGISIPD